MSNIFPCANFPKSRDVSLLCEHMNTYTYFELITIYIYLLLQLELYEKYIFLKYI